MNEITITAEMTFREYNACQDALLYAKGERIFLWSISAVGAACLASSAALTWGTAASILTGLALAAFIFMVLLSGRTNTALRQSAYIRYRESDASYVFTNERILATSRYAQCSYDWAAVDHVVEERTSYLLAVANRYIFVLKRNIAPHNFDDFIHLLRTHGLLREA